MFADWQRGVVDGARRLWERAAARGLVFRPWSLGELELVDADYQALQAAFKSMGPRSLREHDYGTLVEDIPLSKRACFGLLFLTFACEVGRREARGGRLWPFVRDRLGEELRKALLPQGQLSQDLCAAISAACREAGLRHCLDELGMERWYQTAWLQFAISQSAVDDVVALLDGAGGRTALQMLTEKEGGHYSESLVRMIKVLRQHRRKPAAGSIDAVRDAVRDAGWGLVQHWPVIERALGQKRTYPAAPTACGGEDGAPPTSLTLRWALDRSPTLSVSLDLANVAPEEKALAVFAGGRRVALWMRGRPNPTVELPVTAGDPSLEVRSRGGQLLAKWPVELTSDLEPAFFDKDGSSSTQERVAGSKEFLVAIADGEKLDPPPWVRTRYVWGATVVSVEAGNGRPGDVLRYDGVPLWEHGKTAPVRARAFPRPSVSELRGGSDGPLALGPEVVVEREALASGRLVLGGLPFEPAVVLAGLCPLGRVPIARWLRVHGAERIGYGEELVAMASATPWRDDERRAVLAAAVHDHGLIAGGEPMADGWRLRLTHDQLEDGVPDGWRCLVWARSGEVMLVRGHDLRAASAHELEVVGGDFLAAPRAIGVFYGEARLGAWWASDWSSGPLANAQHTFAAIRALKLPFLAAPHRSNVLTWTQEAVVEALGAWLLPRSAVLADIEVPRGEEWLSAVRALLWAAPFRSEAVKGGDLRGVLARLDVEGVDPRLEVVRAASALVELDHAHAGTFLREYRVHLPVFQRRVRRMADNASRLALQRAGKKLLQTCMTLLDLDESATLGWAVRDDEVAALADRWPDARLLGAIIRAIDPSAIPSEFGSKCAGA